MAAATPCTPAKAAELVAEAFSMRCTGMPVRPNSS
jgi:hypothetical protein